LCILKLLVNYTKVYLELASATGCSVTSTPNYVITTNTAFSTSLNKTVIHILYFTIIIMFNILFFDSLIYRLNKIVNKQHGLVIASEVILHILPPEINEVISKTRHNRLNKDVANFAYCSSKYLLLHNQLRAFSKSTLTCKIYT
jgi:hypothetical protein